MCVYEEWTPHSHRLYIYIYIFAVFVCHVVMCKCNSVFTDYGAPVIHRNFGEHFLSQLLM